MIQELIEIIKQKLYLYRNPLRLFVLNLVVARVFLRDKDFCSRCPVPTMSATENFVFTITYFFDFVIVIWVILIHLRENHKDEGHW